MRSMRLMRAARSSDVKPSNVLIAPQAGMKVQTMPTWLTLV